MLYVWWASSTKSCLRITSILDGRVRCFLPVILSTCVSYSITFEYQAQRHLIHSKGTRRDSSIIETLLMGLPNMCKKSRLCILRAPNGKEKRCFLGGTSLSVSRANNQYFSPYLNQFARPFWFRVQGTKPRYRNTDLFFKLRPDSLSTLGRTSTRSEP